ncbi:hypothetical protein B0H34DRAFT_149359 [Crassisporium funariophilum]|nr:hypothetical protein B0H34DRAFT_149359 [Crassisporium funariophilum]
MLALTAVNQIRDHPLRQLTALISLLANFKANLYGISPLTSRRRSPYLSGSIMSVAYLIRLKLSPSVTREITTQFGYIPVIRPSPFSPMRQLAYRNGSHIIGPKMDLVGWQTLERIQIQGKIFNDRPVHIWCTLFLAKPLCYTRGSVIPFCMELESDDVQALDCLSSPKAIIVRLRRRIRYYTNGEKTLDSLEWRDSVHDSHLAVWWPSTESTDLDLKSKRILNGELRLKSDMKPTSAMGDFRVEYSVIVLAFDAPGYEPASSKLEVLREQAVEIATAYGQGPRPRMFAPPAYDTEVAPIPAAPMAFHAMSGAFFV